MLNALLRKITPKPVKRQLNLYYKLFGSPKDNRSRLLAQSPKGGLCVEIGVWKGDFSARVLACLKPTNLILVDPWLYQPSLPNRLYSGKVAKNQSDMDSIADAVAERFRNHTNVTIARMTSEEFLSGQPPETIDWVYVDGDHSFEAVLRDLELSWRTLKLGGILCGDDLRWRPEEGNPVQRAVVEFCSSKGISYLEIGDQFMMCRAKL